MKNATIFILTIIIGLSPVYFVSAQNSTSTSSVADLLAIIEQLKNQIQELQKQVAELKAQMEAVKIELKFTKTLQKGATGDEVKQLQQFLANFEDVYPEGLITGYFGPLTESAVKKWQEQQGIESVGVVGPKTRAKLNELVTVGAGASGNIPPGLQLQNNSNSNAQSNKEEKVSTTTMVATAATTPAITAAATSTEEKITICHIPPGDPNNKQTITIGQSALQAHLAHGDYIGVCQGNSGGGGGGGGSPVPTPMPTPQAPTLSPSNLVANLTDNNQVNLSWQYNSTNESEFKIYRQRSCGGVWEYRASVGTNEVSYLDTNVTAGTYKYKVNACNSVGCSNDSSSVLITVYGSEIALDTSWGNNGMVTYNSSGTQIDLALNIGIDSDCNIYVVGRQRKNGNDDDWAIRKYAFTGALDTSWGDAGMVIYDFGATYEEPWDIVFDSERNIYVAGVIGANGGDWAVRKYTSTGALDTSWGTNGMVTYNSGGAQDDIAYDMAIDSERNIYIGGYQGTDWRDWAIRKYTSTGALDTSWGIDGMVNYSSGNSLSDIVYGITIDSVKNIYVSGYIGVNGRDWAIRKYTSTGALDTSWGIDGMVTYDSGNYQDDKPDPSGIIIDSSNNIFVVGDRQTNGYDWLVLKYTPAGILDTSWGDNGMIVYTSSGNLTDEGSAIAMDSLGNIFVGGYLGTSDCNYCRDWAVRKYSSAGILDTTWGTNGMVTYNSGGVQDDVIVEMVIDSVDNIYVAGYQGTNGGDWVVRKYFGK